MKEVVVILSLMWAGNLAIYGGMLVAEQIDVGINHLPELISDAKFVGFEGDEPLTRSDIDRYKRIYSTPSRESGAIGNQSGSNRNRYCPTAHCLPSYSQPSSLISVTSNPSDRNASPAIF